jgi:hypothetical protein
MKSTNLITRRIRTKALDIGIGGLGCYCCAPCPKDLKRIARMGRRKMDRDIMRFEFKAEGE